MAFRIDSDRRPTGVGSPDATSAPLCSNPAMAEVLQDMRGHLAQLGPSERIHVALAAKDLSVFEGQYNIQIPTTTLQGRSEMSGFRHIEKGKSSGRPQIHMEGQSLFPGLVVDFKAQAETRGGKLFIADHTQDMTKTHFIKGPVSQAALNIATPVLVREFGTLASAAVNNGLRGVGTVERFTIGRDPKAALVFTLQRR